MSMTDQDRARSWPAAPAATSSRAWPWPRRCARAAGACTGWARPAAWRTRSCRRSGFALEPVDFSRRARQGPGHAGAAAAAPAARVLAGAAGGAPRAARRGAGPGRLHHLSGRDDGRAAAASRWCCTSRTRSPGWPTRCWRAWPTGCSPPSRTCCKGRRRQWVGNPLRAAFTRQPEPAERFAGRSGPLQAAGGGRQPGRARAQRHRAAGAGADAGASSAPWSCTRAAPSRSTHCAPTTPPPGVEAELHALHRRHRQRVCRRPT